MGGCRTGALSNRLERLADNRHHRCGASPRGALWSLRSDSGHPRVCHLFVWHLIVQPVQIYREAWNRIEEDEKLIAAIGDSEVDRKFLSEAYAERISTLSRGS